MKCKNCGLVEADCEFDIKLKNGSTIQGPVQVCWNCLKKRFASIEKSEKKMTKTPEGRVSAALRQAVINCGGEIRKVQWQGRVGAPDWLVMMLGCAVFVEAKATGSRPRKSQLVEFGRIEQASGIPILVIDRAEDAIDIVNALLSRAEGNHEAYIRLIEEYSFERFSRATLCG